MSAHGSVPRTRQHWNSNLWHFTNLDDVVKGLLFTWIQKMGIILTSMYSKKQEAYAGRQCSSTLCKYCGPLNFFKSSRNSSGLTSSDWFARNCIGRRFSFLKQKCEGSRSRKLVKSQQVANKWRVKKSQTSEESTSRKLVKSQEVVNQWTTRVVDIHATRGPYMWRILSRYAESRR